MVMPLEDKYSTTRNELLDQLAYAMGGRVAEELVFHDPTTGASNDIEKATATARKMVTQFGMSERVGAIKLGSGSGEVFLGRDMGHERDYSEDVAAIVDDEVRKLIEAAHDEAWEVLAEYRDVLDDLVLALLEHETLNKDQLAEIFAPVKKRDLRPVWLSSENRAVSSVPPVMGPNERKRLNGKPFDQHAPQDQAAEAGEANVPGCVARRVARRVRRRPARASRSAAWTSARAPGTSAPVRSTCPGSRRPSARSCSPSARTPTATGCGRRPARVARAYAEIFAGLSMQAEDVLPTTFDLGHDEMVLVKDIEVYSHLRAPPGAVPRRGARRLHPLQGRPDRRAVEARPAGRRLRPPPAGAGAADHPDRRRADGASSSRAASSSSSSASTCACRCAASASPAPAPSPPRCAGRCATPPPAPRR